MKKLILLLIFIISISCSNQSEQSVYDKQGNFIKIINEERIKLIYKDNISNLEPYIFIITIDNNEYAVYSRGGIIQLPKKTFKLKTE